MIESAAESEIGPKFRSERGLASGPTRTVQPNTVWSRFKSIAWDSAPSDHRQNRRIGLPMEPEQLPTIGRRLADPPGQRLGLHAVLNAQERMP